MIAMKACSIRVLNQRLHGGAEDGFGNPLVGEGLESPCSKANRIEEAVRDEKPWKLAGER